MDNEHVSNDDDLQTNSKKRKLADSSPPAYGTQSYWENRYRSLHDNNKNSNGDEEAHMTTSKLEDGKQQLEHDNPLPFHQWYFTYGEIRPLLLPLILGELEETALEGTSTSEDDDNDQIEYENVENAEGQEEKDEKEQQAKQVEKEESEYNRNEKKDESLVKAAGIKVENLLDKKTKDDDDDGHNSTGSNNKPKEEETTVIANDSDDNDDEIYEEDDGESCDEDGEDVVVSRDGLAKNGPVSILEVGCGDVPLAIGLGAELKKLELATGAGIENIVDRIVCIDFSETVINLLKEAQKKYNDKHVDSMEDKEGTNNRNGAVNFPIEYEVADAQKLPYPDDTFHLVMEKGTLDAVLSDELDGVSKCTRIVTECARVLRIGGYFLVVSHNNAHADTNQGLPFLHEIVTPGLYNYGGTWSIEVHGSKDSGPAVYIFNKKSMGSTRCPPKTIDPNALEIQFFSY